MAKPSSLVAGLICTMSPELHDVWGETVRAPSREGLTKLAICWNPSAQKWSIRVSSPPVLRKASSTGRMLRAAGVDVLVAYVARWSYGSAVVAAASECGVPVVVWTDTDIVQVGIVGASVVRGSLDEAGITNCLVYGDFDDPETRQELAVRVLGAAAGIHLRGQVYGLMGSRSLGMYPAAVDANQWRRQFGLEVESWDQSEVLEKAKALPEYSCRG